MTVIFIPTWEPTAKDLQTGRLSQRRYVDRSVQSGTSTSFSYQSAAVPPDTVRVITHVSYYLDGGATARPLSALFQHFAQGTTLFATFTATPDWAIAAGGEWGGMAEPWWIMGPGEDIRAQAVFDLDTSSNSTRLHIWGFDLPRGTLEL